MNMKDIYRKIAKEHGVSPAEVKRDMEAAIDYAYKKNDKSEGEKLIQENIPCKGEVPNAEEFIQYAVTQIKQQC